MSLDPATLREAGAAFSDALPPGADARRAVEDQLQQLAQALPAPDIWAAFGHGDEATLALLAGDLLVTISLETGLDVQPGLVVRGDPLRVTEVLYRQHDQQSFWEFGLHKRDSLRIEGRVTAEGIDRAESFARALAASIGWRIAEPASSVPVEADRQRITDIWGNPVSRRKRR